MATTEVVLRIRRFDPSSGGPPRWEDVPVSLAPGMTVLDALRWIKEGPSPTLTWRSSCRMGVCGSCGMFINGRPRLACNTQMADLHSAIVRVAPLPDFPIIRDLVPDLARMFDSHAALAPYLIRGDREEQERPTREYRQTPEEMERYLQFSYCIKCGCCLSACPTYATDPAYSGPMPLAQAQRYNADGRDGGFAARAAVLAGSRGPWRCHYAGECSRVCPKGVDPARAIQFLRRDLVLGALGLRRLRRPAPVVEAPRETRRRPDIPETPAPSVTRV